jgi:hypothetical protein
MLNKTDVENAQKQNKNDGLETFSTNEEIQKAITVLQRHREHERILILAPGLPTIIPHSYFTEDDENSLSVIDEKLGITY